MKYTIGNMVGAKVFSPYTKATFPHVTELRIMPTAGADVR
jgi:hypothetical protein